MHHGHKTRKGAAEYQKSCQNASRSFSHTMRTILVARMLQAIRCFATMQRLSVCCSTRSPCADRYSKYNANIEKSDAHSGVNVEARMPLAGDLSGFSVDEVISLIMRGGKSGRLVLKNDAVESSLFFDAGAIVEVIHGRVHGPGALCQCADRILFRTVRILRGRTDPGAHDARRRVSVVRHSHGRRTSRPTRWRQFCPTSTRS